MPDRKPRAAARPLDTAKLGELALRYAGKYATTRAKLRDYLKRKIRERGWEGAEPDIAALTERFADLGYVDDRAYALGKSRSLAARGYGKRRLAGQLRIAGIDEADGTAALDLADEEAVAAALRFARRRRIGPFAVETKTDPKAREKAIAAMIRAGHGFALAKIIAGLPAETEPDFDALQRQIRSAVD